MESVVDDNGGGSRRVMTELCHIKVLLKQLDVHMGACPDLKHLAVQIFTVTEKSISLIRSGNFDGRKRSAICAGLDSPPLSATPSPLSGVPKKRKMMGKGEHRVRLSSAGGGADTPKDDGFSWRKYGQKEILGSLNPRGYYRCTYKSQGCTATRQVQRADEDPTLFDVTYHGTHTCVHRTAAAANVQPAQATPNPDASILLKSLSSSLTVNTVGLTSGLQQSTPFSFSSPAVSGPLTPENCFAQGVSLSSSSSMLELSTATSDSNYNPLNPFEEEWGAQSELVSALVSAMSMQQHAMEVEADFSLDGLDLFDDLNFDVSILDYLPCLR